MVTICIVIHNINIACAAPAHTTQHSIDLNDGRTAHTILVPFVAHTFSMDVHPTHDCDFASSKKKKHNYRSIQLTSSPARTVCISGACSGSGSSNNS